MRTSSPFLLIALALACTDYNVHELEDPIKGDSDPVVRDTEQPQDTEPPPDEDCEDQTLPAYETSTDGDCEN